MRVEKCVGVWGRWSVWKNVGEVWRVAKCFGVWGSSLKRGVREVCWSVGEGEERWGCEKMWGRCGKVCWGVGKRCGKVGEVGKYGIGVVKCFG